MIRPDQQACKSPIRFCQEPISMVADIEGMFHQVQVAPQDCQGLRFLWWPNSVLTEEPVDHQMQGLCIYSGLDHRLAAKVSA